MSDPAPAVEIVKSKSLIYPKFLEELWLQRVLSTDKFHCMLLTAGYSPSERHWRRGEVDKHEVRGEGYVQGGFPVAHAANAHIYDDKLVIFLGGFTVPVGTFSARYGVYYRASGRRATDMLIACIEFDNDPYCNQGWFRVGATELRLPIPAEAMEADDEPAAA